MKRLLLAVTLFLGSFYAFAQTIDSTNVREASAPKTPVFKGVKYGVRGGYNISNLDFENHPPLANKHRNSFYFGAFADITMSKVVALVPELQFSAEGGNDESLNLDYIQMPVLFKFRLSEKLRFGLGPQVGLKVHVYEDGMTNMAYSGVAGIDYKINYTLFADVRYTYGARNIFDDHLNVAAKNTNIQIGVGYKF